MKRENAMWKSGYIGANWSLIVTISVPIVHMTHCDHEVVCE